MIDRSLTRDTPASPTALSEVAKLFGTRVAETILAAVMRPHTQAVHMIASDPIKLSLDYLLQVGGRPHMG